MTTAFWIAFGVCMLLLLILVMTTTNRYGLAKVIAKDMDILENGVIYQFTVVYSNGNIEARTIEVSETVYNHFKPGDYITIRV